jgi:phosphate uptake regulator
MKRKVNRVGQNTLTVSIPNKWARKMGINPGDEVDVEELKSSLLIGATPKKPELSVEIDISGFGCMINRAVCAIYKSGFHHARIKYTTAEELKTVQDTIDRTCHTYEVMGIKDNKIEIRNISELDYNNFDNILKKSGFAALEMAKDTLEGIKKNDYELLESVVIKDKIVDRHTDFTRRIINMNYPIMHEKIGPLYVICEQTEILADIFKVMSKEVINKSTKVADDLILILFDIVKMIDLLYKIVSNLKLEYLKELGILEQRIKKKIDIVCSKSRNDCKIICHLNNIFETCFEMKSAIMTMKFGDLALKEKY